MAIDWNAFLDRAPAVGPDTNNFGTTLEKAALTSKFNEVRRRYYEWLEESESTNS
jgi:hypothetical protein